MHVVYQSKSCLAIATAMKIKWKFWPDYTDNLTQAAAYNLGIQLHCPICIPQSCNHQILPGPVFYRMMASPLLQSRSSGWGIGHSQGWSVARWLSRSQPWSCTCQIWQKNRWCPSLWWRWILSLLYHLLILFLWKIVCVASRFKRKETSVLDWSGASKSRCFFMICRHLASSHWCLPERYHNKYEILKVV